MSTLKFFLFDMMNAILKKVLARAHFRALCAHANFQLKVTFCKMLKHDCLILARSARASARAVAKCAPKQMNQKIAICFNFWGAVLILARNGQASERARLKCAPMYSNDQGDAF